MSPLTIKKSHARKQQKSLTVRRNYVRDYVDSAALADNMGLEAAAVTLALIDDYYTDPSGTEQAVASQVARQFAQPLPHDAKVISELARYKQIAPRWSQWRAVTEVLAEVATLMADPGSVALMTSRTLFRNVDVSADDPVETWPTEAMQSVLERGGLPEWRRIIAAVRRDPWGPVSRTVEYVLSCDRPYGTAELMEHAITRERALAQAQDKQEVAERFATALHRSGLTRAEFARRLGTSASRLSTYLSGRVVPSAALLVRAEKVAGTAGD